MNNYLVVADDFTGANDTGVQICRRGIPVRVVFSGLEAGGSRSETASGSCVLDTESRFLSRAGAYEKILTEGETIPFGNFHRVIKKVDSTIRGNIAAETKALVQCFNPELVIFAPAYPDLGRTTINRIHHINGKPLSQTELAHDPRTPVSIDDIQKIMAAAFAPGEKVIHVGLDAIRTGLPDLDGARVFCFDAETNDDLKRIVHRALESGRRILWVGCAGLTDILLSVDVPLPPVLAVVASLSSVCRAQVLFAEGQGISLVKVPLHAFIENKDRAGMLTEEIVQEALALTGEGKDIILLPSSTYCPDEYQKDKEIASRAGISSGEMSNFTLEIISQIALQILEGRAVQHPAEQRPGLSGLFLSGGDTAISCFEKLSAIGSNITGEIAVGIPIMKLAGGKYDGLKVVTKAGAFGREDAIYYGMRKLKEVTQH